MKRWEFQSSKSNGHHSLTIAAALALPLFTILGIQIANTFEDNLVLGFILVAMVLQVVYLTRKELPIYVYELTTFLMALSLVYMYSLFSSYLIGSDATYEYYIAQFSNARAKWISSNPAHSYNALLSITIFPVSISHVTGLDLNWVFKAVYPIILAAVPLFFVKMYSIILTKHEAFIACFFLMAMPAFFSDMPWLLREDLGWLFFVLSFYIIITGDKLTWDWRRVTIQILFGLGLAFSSYASTYLLIIYVAGNIIWNVIFHKLLLKRQLRYLVFMTTASLTWYIYHAKSSAFVSVVQVAKHVWASLFDLGQIQAREATILRLFGFLSTGSTFDQIQRLLFITTQLLIVLGVCGSLLNIRSRRDSRIRPFDSLGAVAFGVLGLCIMLPHFSKSIGISRMYNVALMFLSPFMVRGGYILWRITSGRTGTVDERRLLRGILVPLVCMYFLVNTGLLHEIFNDIPASLPLSFQRMRKSHEIDVNRDSYGFYIDSREVTCARWLTGHMSSSARVYTDECYWIKSPPLVSYAGLSPDRILLLREDLNAISMNTYTYLGYINICQQRMRFVNEKRLMSTYDITRVRRLLESQSRIYCNGAARVLRS